MKNLDLKVVSQDRISADCYYLVLKSKGSFGSILPGQFIMLSFPGSLDPLLPRPMGFFRILKNEKDSTTFSIGYVTVGKGTNLLAGLCAGDKLMGTGPLGNGWNLNGAAGKAVMIAGGIGITPFYMLGQELIKKDKKPILLYGAKKSDDLVFKDEFKDLEIETILYTDDGSTGVKGLVSEGLSAHLNKDIDVFACGPYKMLHAVSTVCLAAGIDPQLSFDRRMACGFGVCLGCNLPVKNEAGAIKNVRVCKEGPVFKGSEVTW
jgi:dihydroorotate dehydrogenase electron transfer subunit